VAKTILPHRAVAKLDLRLVPDMKADEALAALKAQPGQTRLWRHRGEHDGWLRPEQHSADAPLIRAQVAFYRGQGLTR